MIDTLIKRVSNKHNSYLLLALLQSGSVPELDMPVSKHFLPGQFIYSFHMTIGIFKEWLVKYFFVLLVNKRAD
jgi:hypothetical protein